MSGDKKGVLKVFGPFNPSVHKGTADKSLQIRWRFNGIRSNQSMSHWALSYDIVSRYWFALSSPVGQNNFSYRDRIILKAHGIDSIAEDVTSDIWHVDTPPLRGTITEILRAKMTAEGIALATSASILNKGSKVADGDAAAWLAKQLGIPHTTEGY